MYRVVHDRFWTDPKVRALDPKEKLLFLYLITNPHSHISGLYYIPLSIMSHESGMKPSEVSRCLSVLTRLHRVFYHELTETVWVKHMLKHQANHHSVKILGSVASQLANFKDSGLIGPFLEEYKALKIPYQYHIDTVSIPHPELEIQSVSVEVSVTGSDKNKFFSSESTEFGLAKLLLDLILKNDPKHKSPNLQAWCKSIDLMIRIDGREPDEIRRIIEASQADPFWKNNILSTDALRSKYDQLRKKLILSPATTYKEPERRMTAEELEMQRSLDETFAKYGMKRR